MYTIIDISITIFDPLWIKDASFNMQKNGWELYDAVELLGEFNTFKSAKAYAKMLIDSGAYYCYTIDRR